MNLSPFAHQNCVRSHCHGDRTQTLKDACSGDTFDWVTCRWANSVRYSVISLTVLAQNLRRFCKIANSDYWFRHVCRPSVDSSWNVMAHDDAREGKWRGNWRIEWVASTLHTTSEHGISSITTAYAHTSAVSSRLNWSLRRFKWTRPFRRKTEFFFCMEQIGSHCTDFHKVWYFMFLYRICRKRNNVLLQPDNNSG